MSSATFIKKSKVGAADLCDKCLTSLSLDDSADEFFPGTMVESDHTPTLRHIGEDKRFATAGSGRIWQDALPDLPAMAETADAGCHLCQFLRNIILQKQVPFEGPVTISGHYIWGFDRDVKAIRDDGLVFWRCGIYNSDKLLRSIHFSVETKSEGLIKWLRMDKRRCLEPLDPSNVGWIKDQIRLCEEQCNHITSDSQYLPTRLIDVGTQHGDDARLIITADLPKNQNNDKGQGIKYATLSYCWGPKEDAKQQIKTTKDNLSLHIKGIPLSGMSPVVRDTILVCRALNIRYIWVDALCILQGDIEDWDKESEMMGQVYYCSFLTICPSSSTSCLEGFLGPRASGVDIEFQSSLRQDIRGTYSLFECTDMGRDISYTTQSMVCAHLDIDQSTWDTRGWTLQERILSLRILFFGASMCHFFCESKEVSENDYVSGDSSLKYGPGTRSLINSALPSLASYWERLRFYTRWDSTWILSTKKWTYREDFLPALSGFAKEYAAMTNDVYLAGLWKDRLCYDLTWEVHFPEPGDLDQVLRRIRHQSPYVAPSWSWASQEKSFGRLIDLVYDIKPEKTNVNELDRRRFKKVMALPCHLKPEFTLEDFDMELWEKNRFGRLKGGSIKVFGKVVPFPSAVLTKGLAPGRSCRGDCGYFFDGLGICQLTGPHGLAQFKNRGAYDYCQSRAAALPRPTGVG